VMNHRRSTVKSSGGNCSMACSISVTELMPYL
jgi:hypothetical protein